MRRSPAQLAFCLAICVAPGLCLAMPRLPIPIPLPVPIAPPIPPDANAIPHEARRAVDPNGEFLLEQKGLVQDLRGVGTRAVSERPVDDVVRLEIRDGHLRARLVADDISGDINYPLGQEGNGAMAIAMLPVDTAPPRSAFSFRYVRFDPKTMTSVMADFTPLPGRLNLSATFGGPLENNTVQLGEFWGGSIDDESPSEPTLRLSFDRVSDSESDPPLNLVSTATSFAEMIERNHENVRNILTPGLTALRSMHVLAGVSEAEASWILEADRPADAKLTATLQTIVLDLDAKGGRAIPELRKRLRDLGPAAILAFQRLPRERWSVDLSVDADVLCAGLMPITPDRAGRLLASPSRLVDLLYSNDPALRKSILDRVRPLVKDMVHIDPNADPYDQVTEIEALRMKLMSAK